MNATIINLHRLRAILNEHPTLSGEGLGLPNLPLGENPDGGIDLKCVCKALEWISARCEKTETIRRKDSSYGLKHIMQDETDQYSSNGEFILAALLLGYRVDSTAELNPFLNLKVLPLPKQTEC